MGYPKVWAICRACPSNPHCCKCYKAVGPGETIHRTKAHNYINVDEQGPRSERDVLVARKYTFCTPCVDATEELYRQRAPLLKIECAVCERVMTGRLTPRMRNWDEREFDEQRYGLCSGDCTKVYNRKIRHVRRDAVVCKVCGQRFEKSRSDAVTCSNTCRQRRFRMRRARDPGGAARAKAGIIERRAGARSRSTW